MKDEEKKDLAQAPDQTDVQETKPETTETEATNQPAGGEEKEA